MNEIEILKQIEEIAKEFKLDATVVKATKQQPFDILLIYIGSNATATPFVLNIMVHQQILDPSTTSSFYKIEFKLKLPLKIADFSYSQTSNLIALINRSLELPGFETSEIDNEIFYRHVLLFSGKKISKELILGLIGMIKLTLDLHIESIESVSSGKLSYDELLRKALK
jgi:hypothetical protein